MRVTVFGATGLLGKELLRQWKEDEVTGLNSKDADIRNSEQVSRAVEKTQPKWIVLAAAYTDVDGCESNRQLAFDVNTQGAANVARAAKQNGARLLFLSTDYVFDGNGSLPYETDHPRAPRSVYGKSKAQAEAEISELLPDCCIVRTSWLFGAGGRCFPDTILKLSESRKEIDVVDDQRGSPTYTPDFARAIRDLCHRDVQGIVHVTNRGDCSWFEFASEIVELSGSNTIVRPTSSDKFPRPAERPKYSVLSPNSLHQHGITMPDWRFALKDYLARRRGR
ncbi:MAG: dTDP-4-dehydrorhamnose reductase [Acidobacteriota bacterium]|nr:dTDP-4-dehydrorhamnose reductase [Acidobacteriota bacterium]